MSSSEAISAKNPFFLRSTDPPPRALNFNVSSLEWVNLLTPEALDAFLVEKMEARRTLVELDLEPSGLVIKHDDDGEVERVEPANSDKVRERVAKKGKEWRCWGVGALVAKAVVDGEVIVVPC